MRGSSHEALGLAAAYTTLNATNTPMDTAALPLAALSLSVLIVWEAIATQRQRADVRRHKAWEAELLERGVTPLREDGPSVRWHGPPRKLSRPLRLIAYTAAFTVAIPIGVAVATSRLPDLLEFGPIPHRGPTHWLLTAIALIVGTSYALAGRDYGAAVTLGLAVGYLGHLAADGMTLNGVPFLWPIWREDLHLLPRPMRVRMGSPVDTLLAFGVLGAMVLSLAPRGTAPALAERHVCKHRHKHAVTHTHKRCHHATGAER